MSTVRLSLSVSCVSPPLVPIFGQFLFLSSFVIISSQPCVFSWLVPSPVLLIILFAPSFPSLYKSSVFPVSLSSINVISFGVYLFSSDLCVLRIKCWTNFHVSSFLDPPAHPWHLHALQQLCLSQPESTSKLYLSVKESFSLKYSRCSQVFHVFVTSALHL